MSVKHLALTAWLAFGAACSSKPALDCTQTCSTVADCPLQFSCDERVCVPESGGFSLSECPGHGSSAAASSSASSSSASSASSSTAAASSAGSTGRAICAPCVRSTDCASDFCPDDGTRPLFCQPRLCTVDATCGVAHTCITDSTSPLAGRCQCGQVFVSTSTAGSTGSSGTTGSTGSSSTSGTGTSGSTS